MANVFNLCDLIVVELQLCQPVEAAQVGDAREPLEAEGDALCLRKGELPPLLVCQVSIARDLNALPREILGDDRGL
jgi:hypothetical protein